MSEIIILKSSCIISHVGAHMGVISFFIRFMLGCLQMLVARPLCLRSLRSVRSEIFGNIHGSMGVELQKDGLCRLGCAMQRNFP
ncbi:hypothetical protein BDV38DRAFT_254044 [Aspergillus pseudotamarii]|uniref:Uncharacterized protein n=1 Tax=Aspergillus pseudotamarii TaxID=132259 RepID=A0A5N6SP38_ASPPS|nr:uncharacterized protein BDV38DRAFT_254044 [Aspergillus pseudotamarii]KAE8134914.1 hypothetical protein BDV38DRAFT_254044 [Aspergillus pseudotamarii]